MIARLDGARVFRSEYVHVVNDACARVSTRYTRDNDGKKAFLERDKREKGEGKEENREWARKVGTK